MKATTRYTPAELMVVAGAREICDGDVVFVGMRLPLLAFALAKRTHAPRAIGFFENGIIRDEPSSELLYTMGDAPNVEGASMCCPMTTVMGLMQKGDVDLGFIGGAEVDQFGNINTSYIGDPSTPSVKLPGSGGAGDIASLARRFVVIIEHDKRRLVERVGYVTSPGFGNGPGWRAAQGLPRGGPCAIITTKAVLRFGDDDRAYVHSIHPGLSKRDVADATGWPVRFADAVAETTEPTDAELTIIRRCDPQGFWTS
jgi:glutaconate CoA-transferase, subunit B